MGVAKILKEANADLTIKDNDGYTAINLTKGGEMCEILHQVLCVCVCVCACACACVHVCSCWCM